MNDELDAVRGLPKCDFFTEISETIDRHIHRSYRLYAGNYVACDLLDGKNTFAGQYTEEEKVRFENYWNSRLPNRFSYLTRMKPSCAVAC